MKKSEKAKKHARKALFTPVKIKRRMNRERPVS